MQNSNSATSRVLSFLRNDFFDWLLLLILLTSAIMSFDSAFQLFSPSVQVVETIYENGQIAVFRYFGAPIFYNVQVVKTYWIKAPLVPIRGLNLSLPNPSNFSIYDGTKYMPWEQKPFAINVEVDPTLAYTLLTNSGGNVTSISVMPLNGSQVKPKSFIKLRYNDVLSYQFITTSQPVKVNLGNGSVSITMSLIVNNTDSRSLHSDQFALFSSQDYGNMTSYTVFENGTLKPSQWNNIWEQWQWLWASFRVDPHSFVNFTISTVFEEAPH